MNCKTASQSQALVYLNNEVAEKIADALEVSLDFLTGNSKQVAFDKQTLRLIHYIEELEPAVKDKLFFLANWPTPLFVMLKQLKHKAIKCNSQYLIGLWR